ncbi:zona pellucida glycoprotein 3f, tandem duplicate 2 [Colossoma macropomum]|uniref:zona pellucida glycoprotein 3f, tandem duplicate 2 n=1 Tax=Colossoma macropomum TaxID=42526 RepID=UPI00186521E8|nr:zona pellucida glycoprotein 3f, tandem duplicate 2 [Colossoma macropomum]
MLFLRQCFLLCVTAVSVLCYEDIYIKCTNNSVMVTWKVNKDLAEKPFRLLLGSCFPSKFIRTADGGEAIYQYRLSECHFLQKRTQKKLIYENELAFRPKPKPNPAAFTYPVVCASERPEWIHPFLRPGFHGLRGQGSLIFHIGLLNDDLSGPALSDSFPVGSFIHIWAAVEQQAHQPLMLYLEECVASTTQTLGPESLMYPIITNEGCLVDSKTGYSRFLPRYHSSSVVLQLQAFSFALEQEVYLHCSLVVWDPEYPNEEKKACNYNKDLGGWELLDDPSMSDLCRCCDYSCSQRVKRGLQSEFRGLAQSVVLGPLTITASPSRHGNPIQDGHNS